MLRLAAVAASLALIGFGAGAYARTHVHDDPVDPAKGAKLTSRIPCDGATNPQDQVNLAATFSNGPWERAFRIQEFEHNDCKRMDFGFACVQPEHDVWKQEWTVDSQHPQSGTFGLSSCTALQEKDAPQYVLTGWYREGSADKKLPWKQAVIKQVPSRWETYEFTDPNGETARIEINRR